ncbi:protein translocase subunit secA [Arcanobacterium phocae]|uniref:Protein translocase subunit SecA n=1 Tax=Arcanobacterium phocae TaxID=131112 RepID=A0A1H2L9U7_9ACTO|nr:preprotein translocase subunit SecA [Arcanobacterium phocae]SDU77699.1 protein translocase subunit secA [Arcanobacterium phocae]
MRNLLNKLLRAGEGRILKKLTAITKQVNLLEDVYKDMTDDELKAVTGDLRERLAQGETLDELMPDAFAAVREASVRTLGQRHYDVQIMGGAALHLGNIAEMKTGEGKTLVATLASYLNALSGDGVHVVTVNDYLASYQSELMGRVFRFLGMTTGCILEGQTPQQRREQYAADITYGTNNQFGFDYLRDNMAMDESEMVQRGHNFAIVDEVDSILIDEARTPLIISGQADGDANRWYVAFADAVGKMRRDTDYEVDEKKRNAGILEPGIDKVEDLLGIDNLYESVNTPLIGYLNNAIKAKELFHRDKDYIVRDGEVLIVDEHTGRVLPGRRYNDGMHQAIEAKEGVEIKAENQTLASITLQNYFRMYNKLSGMTGTAETEAEEFASTYDIGVVPIPTNKPVARVDHRDIVYATSELKFAAIVEDIKERYAKGQPVLVGTASVEHSELLSGLLKKAHIPHEVLNAKQHEREASVVAMAGRKHAITVATNMAGRGTDIMLGGNAEHIALEMMSKLGLDPEENTEEYEERWPEILQAAKDQVAAEHDEVTELGGLYVLGSERHESRRIDNQLRGRAGRQGDPGESRFYLSLDDDLLRLFGSTIVNTLRNSAQDEPLDFKMMANAIQKAQAQLDGRNAEQRKNVLKYDDVMNDQRTVVYTERRRILAGDDVENQIQSFMDFVINDIVSANTEGSPDDWDLDMLWADMRRYYKPSFTPAEFIEEHGDQKLLTADVVREEFEQDIHALYEEREEELGDEQMRLIERQVLLQTLDRNWREHLYEMDYLKEGIGLRAMAQRNPLVEYKQEGYQMFQSMNDQIRGETVTFLMGFELPSERLAREAAEAAEVMAGQESLMNAQAVSRAAAAAAASKSEATKAATEKILGLKRPTTATKMTYTSSAKDGSGQARATNAQGREVHGQTTAGSGEPQMNRAQRRAAKKKK